MRPDGQYTLDADPMALALRVQTLEHAVDVLSGCVCDMARSMMLVAQESSAALDEDRPIQAMAIEGEHERLSHIYDRAHGASALMGRSY